MKSCIVAPEILLPRDGLDMRAWAVIACDQHTSDRAYWAELEKEVGDKPSTLRLTLPEIYLEDADCDERITRIAQAMRSYKADGIFKKLPKGFVLVRRKTPYSPERTGIVLAVDLEEYSYEKQSDAAIRATEATILERIPPRLKIRERAELEFPHIMLLYDDPCDLALGDLKRRSDLQKLYDFELNMGGGHVSGFFVPDFEEVIGRFERLKKDGLLFMVGDGNHSLATAKALWEKIKAELPKSEQEGHPARYALCEAVNLYDEGIRFEAIHRLVKGVDAEKFSKYFPRGEGNGALYIGGVKENIVLPQGAAEAVRAVDGYISEYLAAYGGSVDYIHGDTALAQLTKENADFVGIGLPKMDKSELFGQVLRGGSLPRKTFSMGESEEKRYYIEGKEIR